MTNKKVVLIFLTFAITAYAYVTLALSVNNTITQEDRQAIISLEVEKSCANTIGKYGDEVGCFAAIQTAILAIGGKHCALSSDVIEPSEFIKRNYGCCFDRARFIEKAARYYGYTTRHVFLIQPKNGISLGNYLPLGQSTHATTEILTSRGWLGIDSMKPFMLIAEDTSPHTFRNAIDNLDNFPFMQPKDFYSKEIDVIYGLYSRHGNFYGRNFPGPEYVFSELLWNWE
jgi:hypothetical protein